MFNDQPKKCKKTLEAGKHWLAFTCADEAGQEDLVNATVIGPFLLGESTMGSSSEVG